MRVCALELEHAHSHVAHAICTGTHWYDIWMTISVEFGTRISRTMNGHVVRT